MSAATEAVALALKWAGDPSHGYDQGSRWGPDYDCSSFIISVWDAVGVPVKAAGATYTGTMVGAFARCGFAVLSPGVPLRAGDVLVNEANHAAMYIGNGQIVQARINELGTVTGGRTGDQTGQEIAVGPYYNYSGGWDCVLRYEGGAGASVPARPETPADGPTGPSAPSYRPGDRYMVQSGDTLWSIAERWLGDGSLWSELYEYNHLTSTVIHVGDVIELPPANWREQAAEPQTPEPSSDPVEEPEDGDLPQLRPGDHGQAVKVLQILLRRAGYALPVWGVDGDFGEETQAALVDFQRAEGLAATGTVTPVTWAALLV